MRESPTGRHLGTKRAALLHRACCVPARLAEMCTYHDIVRARAARTFHVREH